MPTNPIIETYRGKPIHLYPMVRFRVSIGEMKKFIDLALDQGLSAKEAIKQKKILCRDCNGLEVISFKKI